MDKKYDIYKAIKKHFGGAYCIFCGKKWPIGFIIDNESLPILSLLLTPNRLSQRN